MTARLILPLILLAALAACGADGLPYASDTPEPVAEPGIALSGDAQIGVLVQDP
jgi:hypothetical protein